MIGHEHQIREKIMEYWKEGHLMANKVTYHKVSLQSLHGFLIDFHECDF